MMQIAIAFIRAFSSKQMDVSYNLVNIKHLKYMCMLPWARLACELRVEYFIHCFLHARVLCVASTLFALRICFA
jgi:hypothetical protein